MQPGSLPNHNQLCDVTTRANVRIAWRLAGRQNHLVFRSSLVTCLSPRRACACKALGAILFGGLLCPCQPAAIRGQDGRLRTCIHIPPHRFGALIYDTCLFPSLFLFPYPLPLPSLRLSSSCSDGYLPVCQSASLPWLAWMVLDRRGTGSPGLQRMVWTQL